MSEYTQVLTVTDAARDKINELIEGTGKEDLAVRVSISLAGAAGYQTEFQFTSEANRQPQDLVQDAGTFRLFFDKNSAAALNGANVDFDAERYQGGFRIQYAEEALGLIPPSKEWENSTAQAVQRVIDTQLNPGLASHGGYVELLDIEGGTIFIEMGGGCQGCSHARMTLKDSIEKIIFENVPEITRVLDRTDHADGQNPYYQE